MAADEVSENGNGGVVLPVDEAAAAAVEVASAGVEDRTVIVIVVDANNAWAFQTAGGHMRAAGALEVMGDAIKRRIIDAVVPPGLVTSSGDES